MAVKWSACMPCTPKIEYEAKWFHFCDLLCQQLKTESNVTRFELKTLGIGIDHCSTFGVTNMGKSRPLLHNFNTNLKSRFCAWNLNPLPQNDQSGGLH